MRYKHIIMQLPNVLLKGMAERRQGIPKALATAVPSRQDYVLAANSLLESADSTVLAYLWLAMESNHNIIVIADSCDAEGFVDSLCTLVPRFMTMIDTRGRIADRGTNFTDAVAMKRIGDAGVARIMQECIPDRIIAALGKGGMDKMFSSSKLGVSFIASVPRGAIGYHVVRGLCRRLRVRPENANMLDISISLSRNGDKYGITAVTEYRWLDRAEFGLKGNDFISKRYSNIRIIKDGTLDAVNAARSKVVGGMSRSHLASNSEALGELGRRARFLDSLRTGNSMGKETNPIGLYYEIK
ncbi:MAG: hypothetical protein KGI06_03190 [Candidatus Micrarchaeota archaeon]|nr:hypothetical protein [Candidatus Micrarchaeota archaeon]